MDGCLNITKASIFACMGIASVQEMQLFATKGDKAERSKKKQKKAHGTAAPGGGECGSEWDLTDWFGTWTPEDRWEVECHLMANYDALVTQPERAQMQAQHTEALGRRKREVDQKKRMQKNKHLAYKQHEKYEEARSLKNLQELIVARQRKVAGAGKGAAARKKAALLAELLLQIHIRKHIYGVYRPVAVKWSGSDVDVNGLHVKVKAMVKGRPKKKPPCPPAAPAWEVSPNADPERERLDAQWRLEEAQANRELGALMQQGRYFMARKRGNPGKSLPGTQQQGKKQGKKQGQKQGKRKRAEAVVAADAALEGTVFEDEGTSWVVHDVRFEEMEGTDGEDISGVIVLYYEEGDVEGEEGNESAMEWSTVGEVKRWVTESTSAAAAASHATQRAS